MPAVQAGLGIGFASVLTAARSAQIVRVVPGLRISPLGVWLAVHRQIRSNPRIRLVYDFLADAMGRVLRSQ